MYLAPAPLAPAAADLRSGALPLDQYISEKCAWLESADAEVHALLPEVNRRRRLLQEAEELERRYPDPASSPAALRHARRGEGHLSMWTAS